ncbi:hypothetical protein K8R30_03820 [archaeon]|nr:hypothetical protein [archaeon]
MMVRKESHFDSRGSCYDWSTSIMEDVVYSPGAKCVFELNSGRKVSGLLSSLILAKSNEGAKIGVRSSAEKFYSVSEIDGDARVFYSKLKNDLVLSLGEKEAVE